MSSSQLTSRGLLGVRKFVIPHTVLDDTIKFLKKVGKTGAEGFVLWGGKTTEEAIFRFSTAVIPEQDAVTTEDGLLVLVSGEALFKVNKILYERDEILGGQVHTHPTSAFHSSTDDHYPLVTLLGALSLVLPDFARHAPNDIAMWAWYRMTDYGRWLPAKNTEVSFE